MNLGEFIKSKRHVACLQSNGIEVGEDGREGWLYGDTGLHIEGPESGEDCVCVIENSDWTSFDMYPLEAILYQFGLDEGFFEGPRWTDEETEQWKELFRDAMPIDDDDDGSARQVNANHRLWKHITEMFGEDINNELVDYSVRTHSTSAEFLPHVAQFVLGRFRLFLCDQDVQEYFEYLFENKADYHLDDSPDGICWGNGVEHAHDSTGANVVETIKVAHDALWGFCNPWDDKYRYYEMTKEQHDSED
jgi:hypothetical protein